MKKRVLSFILCIVICICIIPSTVLAVGTRDTSFEETLAVDLKGLGLFKGVSDTNFDLNRAPSRLEALVMLIRVLGKENEALNGSWNHPFTDVAEWADKYVGYAYSNGLTNGVSDTQFGTGTASSYMYLTFVLRALGYSDTNGADFTWDNPYTLAESVGILPDCVNTTDFWRADVVVVSYAALPVAQKGTTQTLAQKLIAAGVFTQEQYYTYYDAAAIDNYEENVAKEELTSKEIYSQCSPAVFCIETYDVDGNAYALGSGFFIDESGIAVTNYHVLVNALSATATLINGKQYSISGVLYFDNELDYAVIKVDGSGFSSLKTGDSSKVAGGETIYAIGNPRGLTNTISDGIVSNPSRADLNGMIQITAPISSGSSGGALLNTHGEVVGVTTASLTSGQNLNFAVPINEVIPDDDISGFETTHGIFSMAEYAEYNEYLTYDTIPEAFDYHVYESEPNDTIAYANPIDNGTSVIGVIDDEYYDAFIVHCNTVGTIEVTLFSNSAPKYVKDLILAIEPVKKTGSEGVSSDYYAFDDGTAGRIARYIIPRAGVYVIYVLSDSLYKSGDLHTDYDFYYCFTPGQTTGENTIGNNGSDNRQELAYEALKTWIINNYNTTMSGDKAYIYTDTATSSNWTEYGVIYNAANDYITLFNGKYYSGSESFAYLSITREDQSFFSRYSYYATSGQSMTFSGTATINSQTFGPDVSFSFSNYSGSSNNISTYSQLAKLMFCSAIDYTNYLYQYYVSPSASYSMEDFGFSGI